MTKRHSTSRFTRIAVAAGLGLGLVFTSAPAFAGGDNGLWRTHPRFGAVMGNFGASTFLHDRRLGDVLTHRRNRRGGDVGRRFRGSRDSQFDRHARHNFGPSRHGQFEGNRHGGSRFRGHRRSRLQDRFVPHRFNHRGAPAHHRSPFSVHRGDLN